MHYYPTPFFGFGDLLSVLFFVLIVFIIIRLIAGPRWRGHYRHHLIGSSSALTILEERYAKGEIDKAEFDAKKKDLLS
jgi:putative membrane protein